MVAKKLRLAKLFRCNNVGVRRSMQGLEECRKDDARGLEVGTAEEQAARRVLILLARQWKRPVIMSPECIRVFCRRNKIIWRQVQQPTVYIRRVRG